MNSISTFDTTKIPLLDLLRDINQGKIQLVDFQRSWCWNLPCILGLICSISLGFPMGSVILLRNGSNIKFKNRLVEGVVRPFDPTIPLYLILDGQQRLTSLIMALTSDKPVWIDLGKRYQPEEHWIYIDIKLALDYPNTDRQSAIISLKKSKKLRQPGQPIIDFSSPEKEYEFGLFPVDQVFKFPQWRAGYCKYWNYDTHKLLFIEQFEAEVIKNFLHYQVCCVKLSDELPPKAICQIFEATQKTTCELTIFDLLAAIYIVYDFDLRSDWAEREKGFAKYKILRLLKNTDWLQAVGFISTYYRRADQLSQGCSPDRLPAISSTRNSILDLEVEQYIQWASLVSKAFEDAAKFLHTQAIFDADDLPYPIQLVIITCLLVILGEGAKIDGVRQRVSQWFYCGAVSGIYAQSRHSAAVRDLIEIPSWLNGGDVPSTIKGSFITAERIAASVQSSGAKYRAISALLRRNGALDFLSGEQIGDVRYFNEKIENHHIFPQRFCQKNGIEESLYNSIVNKTPLLTTTNRFLGGRAPSEYLAALEAQGLSRKRLDEILRSHLIDPVALRNNDFQTFFVSRRQALLSMLGEAMGKSLN